MQVEKMSVYDAKAHFSELIERAQSGQETIITKRGRIVAKLVPAKVAAWDRSAVLNEAEAFRKSVKIKGSVNIRKLIEEGRR
jgi:prevent-host-death family protein